MMMMMMIKERNGKPSSDKAFLNLIFSSAICSISRLLVLWIDLRNVGYLMLPEKGGTM